MKKTGKILLLIVGILFLFIFSCLISSESIEDVYFQFKRQLYGEPIDLESGVINNNFFGISLNASDAEQTRKGINEAIEYAYNNNIEYIKLNKGIYLVDSYDDEKYHERSIILKSNITLDLNGSTIQIESNNKTNYRILSVLCEENVKIQNGFIVGDRYQHEFVGSTTHEWGMGVSILGSKNIELINLQIKDTTGDGIYISTGDNQFTECLKIEGCNISNCRRQGISIISGKKIEIMDCEIYNINGTNPQSGICVECNNPDTEYTDELTIHDNIIYNSSNNLGIHIYRGLKNGKIYNNVVHGNVTFKEVKGKVTFNNNDLYEGVLDGTLLEYHLERNFELNEIELYENTYNNYSVKLEGFKKIIEN